VDDLNSHPIFIAKTKVYNFEKKLEDDLIRNYRCHCYPCFVLHRRISKIQHA